MAGGPASERTWRPADMFGRVERYAYIAIGVLLMIAVAIGIAGVLALLWHSTQDWSGTTTEVFEIVDRLLFVLMLVEILHTVGASVRTGTLQVQPFLVVGLIASVRRVLMITLETSEAMRGRSWTDEVQAQFHASMVELGVLAGLILVMVGSIFLLHKIPHDAKESG